jgi:pimeloyl-ACP methyl ester carboxylesterase
MLLAHDIHGDDSAGDNSAGDNSAGENGAPPLVLIHGITETRASWDPLLASLAARHRVLRVDLRGHGDSPTGETYELIDYATDVAETIAHVGMQQPVVIGHSLGGITATAVAMVHPVRAVVNVDQPLLLGGFKESLTALEPMLRGTPEQFAGAIDAVFTAMAGPLPAKEQSRIGGLRRPRQDVVLGTWSAVFSTPADELNAGAATLAAAVTVPYLALHGIDPGEGYQDWLTGVVPTAAFELWPDHGHYPHLVDPTRFLTRLRTFLA